MFFFAIKKKIKGLNKWLARAKAGRKNNLLIGTRTCIRPLNAGHYDSFIRTIANIGVDVFQGVKVLIPDFESFKDKNISQKEIEELTKN